MIAIGRKNWLFIGSEAAGYRMAVLYSIIASAKRHHVEPFAYVRDLLLQMRSLCCRITGLRIIHSTCLCIAFKSLARQPIGDAINAKVADALLPLPQGQRRLHRRLIHRTRDHQSLTLQDLMQHHAGRSVIWPPIAVQTYPSSSAAARSMISSYQ